MLANGRWDLIRYLKGCNEYFTHAAHSPFFSLQNAVCFIILPFLVHVYSHFIYRVC
jgi:hypothetical protein